MINHNSRKKKLIISYKNITDNIKELFKETYPDGYQDYIQKTIKPNGEPIFVVPLETEDTSYMIKFDVKIDTGMVDEDLDKDLYGDDEQNESSEFAPISEAIEKEEGDSHRVGKLNHGAYEEMLEGLPEDKKEFEMANADIEDEYGDSLIDEDDDYSNDEDEEKDEDDDMEPDDDELLDIEALLEEADSGEGMLREENPPEETKRAKKKESRATKAVKAVGSEVKAAKKAAASKSTKKTATPATKKAKKTEEKNAKTTKNTAKAKTK